MGKDGAGGSYGGPCCDEKPRRIVTNESLERATRQLLDESERMLFADLDENKFLPHLFRAVNLVRKELGMKQLRLDVREEE